MDPKVYRATFRGADKGTVARSKWWMAYGMSWEDRLGTKEREYVMKWYQIVRGNKPTKQWFIGYKFHLDEQVLESNLLLKAHWEETYRPKIHLCKFNKKNRTLQIDVKRWWNWVEEASDDARNGDSRRKYCYHLWERARCSFSSGIERCALGGAITMRINFIWQAQTRRWSIDQQLRAALNHATLEYATPRLLCVFQC